eukprot:COSAG02_NODE_1986_length_10180_cov_38.805575_5_plen_574_part_00
MPVKLSEDEQRAQWAANLAAVAEQRKAEPPRLTQTASSINPLEWDLPSGAANVEAQANAVHAPAPAEVQQKWADDLAAARAQGPPHARRSVGDHEPTEARSDKPGLPRGAETGRQSSAPFGLEQDNPAHVKPQPVAVEPQDREAAQAQWQQTLDAVHSDYPRFARKASDVHLPPSTSGHGFVLSSNGAMKAKPPVQGARAVERAVKLPQAKTKTKTKTEVVESLAAEQQKQSTEATGSELSHPRKMSRARLDALAAPKQTYSPRDSARRRPSSAGDSVASARSTASSSRSVATSSRHHTVPRSASDLQQRQAWKAVASAARESLGPTTWKAMSRAEKKDFLRAAIGQNPEAAHGCRFNSVPANGEMEAQASVSEASSVLSDMCTASLSSSRRSSVAASASSSRRSAGSSVTARTASTGSTGPQVRSDTSSGLRLEGTQVVDAHATVQWNISDQYDADNQNAGNQDNRFVSSMQASMSQSAAAATAAPAPAATGRATRITNVHASSNWNISDQFAGTSDGDQGDRFVTAASASHQQTSGRGGVGGSVGGGAQRRQPVRTSASLQTSSFSLGWPA